MCRLQLVETGMYLVTLRVFTHCWTSGLMALCVRCTGAVPGNPGRRGGRVPGAGAASAAWGEHLHQLRAARAGRLPLQTRSQTQLPLHLHTWLPSALSIWTWIHPLKV